MDDVRTARLLLRRPADDDVPFVLALLSDPATTAHNPSDAVTEIDEARALVTRWQQQWSVGSGYRVVVRRADEQPIGICGAKAVEMHGLPVWNLLYRFVPEAWGSGFAREAALAAVRSALAADPGRPVIARVRPANTASARVAAVIGLERRPDLDLMGDDGADEVWATPATDRPAS
jgi:ribosomal-protein-alanine N-acetyltransferase